MTTIRVIPKRSLTPALIAVLRRISPLSISEIQRAADSRGSVRDIRVFGTDWEEDRTLLAELWQSYAKGDAPFDVFEQYRDGIPEHLLADQLKARLRYFRAIELDQQLQVDLENGFIGSPEEFVPHDDDWFEFGAEP